jgi:hypothetical protein
MKMGRNMEVIVVVGMLLVGVYFTGEVLLTKSPYPGRQSAGKPEEEGGGK